MLTMRASEAHALSPMAAINDGDSMLPFKRWNESKRRAIGITKKYSIHKYVESRV